MLTDKILSTAELNELCQYVCNQMTFTGLEEFDRETLYFAIYWQFCELFGQTVQLKVYPDESNVKTFRCEMQKVFENQQMENLNLLQIVDTNINKALNREYNLKPEKKAYYCFIPESPIKI